MGVSLVRSLAALQGMREDWDALALSAGSPLLESDWFVSAAEAFYEECQLRVAVARTEGAVSGIAPLSLERLSSGSRLTLLGTSRLFEPSGWLSACPDATRELAEYALGLGVPLLLNRVPADADVCRILPAANRLGLSIARQSDSCLAIDTSGTWERYAGRLSRHFSSTLVKLRRRSERTFGEVRVVHAVPSCGEVSQVLDDYADLESAGWKAREGSALGQQHELRAFFLRYLGRAAARGRLRVATLFLGSERAAMEVAVDAYNRRWQLKTAYHEAVARFSPGIQLMSASIRDSFDRGLASYEFLGVAESWEERWLPEVRRYQKLLLYPPSARGLVAAARDLTGFAWRRSQSGVAALRRNARAPLVTGSSAGAPVQRTSQ
jgi:CelD/BcsL family acetyltransferase involved in cellulose biosynthesis